MATPVKESPETEHVESDVLSADGLVERYAARADELAEGGQYQWWSGLAELLRSQAAQLKAAREALDWYELRVGLAGALTEEGAQARAELTEDNGWRAALALEPAP